MLATINVSSHPVISSAYRGKEFYIAPYNNPRRLHDCICSYQDIGGEAMAAHLQKLMLEPVYHIVYPKEHIHRRNIDLTLPIPLSLFTIVNAEDKGTRMQLTKIPSSGASLQNPLLLGQELFVTRCDEYNESGYIVTDGPCTRSLVGTSCVTANFNLSFQQDNGYERVVAKVLRVDGGVLRDNMVGLVVDLAKRKEDGQLLLAQGPRMNRPVSLSCLQLPATPKEQEVFERKVHRIMTPKVEPRLFNILGTIINNGVGVHLVNLIGNSANLDVFNYATAAADYWMVDPADYNKITFVDQVRVPRLLLEGKDPWTDTSRQSMPFGRFARRILNERIITNSEIEAFSTTLGSITAEEFGPEEAKPEIAVVRGADIAKYYSQSRYAESGGTLGSSCMRGVSGKYFDIYVKNPKNCGLLIRRMQGTDTIRARALVWLGDDGVNYVDRRYGITPKDETALLNWAIKNGYKNLWGGSRDSYGGTVRVTLEEPYHSHYPYMDSMCQLNVEAGIISNTGFDSGVHVSAMRDTAGSRQITNIESRCAGSGIMAPKSRMEQTASGDFALPVHLIELRSGDKELKKRALQDELEPGLISVNESVVIAVDSVKKRTSKYNSAVVQDLGGGYHNRADMVFSVMDGGFIHKKMAVQFPDGSFCSRGNAADYKAYLLQRTPNGAKRQPTAEVPVSASQLAPGIVLAAESEPLRKTKSGASLSATKQAILQFTPRQQG